MNVNLIGNLIAFVVVQECALLPALDASWVGCIPLFFIPPFHSGLSSSLNLDVSYIEICHCSLGTFGCSGWLCCFNYLRLYLFKYLPIQLGCTHTYTRFIFFQCTDHTLVCRVIYYLIDGAIADVILLNDEHN